jgi:hypothetical protein
MYNEANFKTCIAQSTQEATHLYFFRFYSISETDTRKKFNICNLNLKRI